MFAIPPNTENSLTIRTERANQLQSGWSLLARRLSALFLDSIVVGFLSQTLFAFAAVCWAATLQIHADLSIPFLLTAFLAGALDSFTGCVLIGAVILSILYFFLPWLVNHTTFQNPISLCLCVISALIANFTYHVLFEAFFAGTPGKRLLKLQVARSNGARVNLFRASFRHVMKFLSTGTIVVVPLLWPILCNRRQMVHDRIVSTMVDGNHSPLLQSNSGVALGVASTTSQLRVTNCAGVPRRIVSAIIDSIIYYVCEGLATAAVVLLVASSVPINLGWFPYPYDGAAIYLIVLAAMFPALLFPSFLFAAFEASPLQASPGKIIMGMRVTSLSGNKCTFMQALEKQFIQGFIYLSLFPTLFLGLIVILISNSNALFLPAGACVFYLVYGAILCWTNDNNQTLIDRWSKRLVVLEPSARSGGVLLNDGGASK